MKDKKDRKEKIEKERKSNKFLEIIKKKWLVNGTRTFLLIAIIIGLFIASNMTMQKLALSPIDFTEEKLYTLTEDSKNKVKNIDKEVKIYFIGYTDDNANLDLAKEYQKVNDKITAEAVNINNRPDLSSKYGIDTNGTGIIIECGDKSKVLTENDLVTYDTSTYETINIAEQKLTSSIMAITSDKTPKIYFLEGYSEYSSSVNMTILNVFLTNEINEMKSLDILSVGKVPDDCDTLVITTPAKDFDDLATNAIIEYVNSGRNILWLNGAIAQKSDMPNVNKILEIYAIKPFELGIIRETDSSKMISESPDFIIPEIQNSKVTKDLYNTTGVILINATKINIDVDKLEELKVAKTELALASEKSYFRTDFTNESKTSTEGEQTGTFVVGAELEKTLKDANEETGETKVSSKLIIFGENIFASDYQLNESSQSGAIQYAYNKDLVLNSIAYLVDREDDIIARKNTGTVTYTATEEQNNIIKVVIFAIPILIIIIGIVVWQIRRRKK